MARIVDEVAAVLARVDPAGAGGYRRQARAYAGDVLRLHREYRAALASCRTRTFVTSHAAFGRLAARYGLRQEAIAGLSPEGEPDPARLAELADLVRREGLTTVFTETLVSPAVAETLAREAGVRTAVLDPIEGLPPGREAAGQGYLSVMRANLAALTEALGCRRT
jgi:zinc transport system substrate-binding protein